MIDGKFKFELNTSGVGELLKSDEMQNVLMSYGSQVSQNAGDGYIAKVMSTRAIVLVVADSEKANQDNLDNNTLLKAAGQEYD